MIYYQIRLLDPVTRRCCQMLLRVTWDRECRLRCLSMWLERLIDREDPSIICLQETKLSPERHTGLRNYQLDKPGKLAQRWHDCEYIGPINIVPYMGIHWANFLSLSEGDLDSIRRCIGGGPVSWVTRTKKSSWIFFFIYSEQMFS